MASLHWRWALLSVFAVLLSTAFAWAEPQFPPLTGRVVDNAGLLSEADEQQLTAELAALEDKSSDQLVVVTLPSLQGYPIEEFGYQLGRHWGIGTKSKDNGVVLIVAPNERKVRIEVGRGLEPILTDALSKLIIENAILPRFRQGDYSAGVKDGVHDIVLVLTGDAAEVEQRAKARRDTDNPAVDWVTIVFWTIIILWVVWNMWRQTRYAAGMGSGPVVASGPGYGGSGRSGGSGGWHSGGRSGGFSGGGGSFGGGGASGGW